MPRFKRVDVKTGSNSSSNPNRTTSSKSSHLRSKNTINRLNMYQKSQPKRDKKGKILFGEYMGSDRAGNAPITAETGRVAPNRRWFGNTKTISQKELDEFRTKMNEQVHDPYSVVLRRKNLPMGLLIESNTNLGGEAVRIDSSEVIEGQTASSVASKRPHILSSETFDFTFGPKKQRKRPKIGATSLDKLLARATDKAHAYEKETNETDFQTKDKLEEKLTRKALDKEDIFMKGQSRRIWSELYKVIDSSDVVVQILDARDPLGTRSTVLEEHMKKNTPHKHMVLIMNKIDLVPSKVAKQWLKILSKDFPTLMFHAEMKKPFGKGSFIQLLRQFAKLHPEKPQISVGFVGFPNVGKSSVINAVKAKKVCNVAPVPGETKVWQYITLFKNVFLIDCPGVVYPDRQQLLDTVQGVEKKDLDQSRVQQGEEFLDKNLMYESELVLKGVVRAEKLASPMDYMPYIVKKVGKLAILRQYEVEFETAEEFLKRLAKKRGRLLKGGEPDVRIVAQQIINDLQRGKLAYFVAPTEKQIEEA